MTQMTGDDQKKGVFRGGRHQNSDPKSSKMGGDPRKSLVLGHYFTTWVFNPLKSLGNSSHSCAKRGPFGTFLCSEFSLQRASIFATSANLRVPHQVAMAERFQVLVETQIYT